MKPCYTSILIISDIEGSSGCWTRKAAILKTKEWAQACVDMSLDVNAVVTALYSAGVNHIRIQDFHRTGYNLLPELIDRRAELSHGFKAYPVPAIGDPENARGLIMIGMHASSGSKGFIAHTVSSQIRNIECNGKSLGEAELLSMVLAPYGIVPLFFSGGPIACAEAACAIPSIQTYSIDKNIKLKDFDKHTWRDGLKKASVASLFNNKAVPFTREGPFKVVLTMRDGPEAARKTGEKWHLPSCDDRVMIESGTALLLFQLLIKIAYLHPFLEKILPLALPLFHIYGKLGLNWVRKQLKKK
ncbi:MAG: M55 family metallopeptidase [Spirochaetales bacterium]|nr:M55 family metallopeptidase [Spirochaetales bacterium]